MGPRLLFSSLILALGLTNPNPPATAPVPVQQAPAFAVSIRTIEKSGNPNFAYSNLVRHFSIKYGMEWQLVTAIMEVESNFNPRAISSKGAIGLMQLLPTTAARYQFETKELYNPRKNLEAGVRHLKSLCDRYQGNKELIIAAYNTGEGIIDHYRKVPPYKATRSFVKKVLDRYNAYLSLAF